MHDDRLDKVLAIVTDLRIKVATIESETKSQTKVLIHTCRKTDKLDRDQQEHSKKDEHRFSRLETGQMWMKIIGGFMVTILIAVIYALTGIKLK